MSASAALALETQGVDRNLFRSAMSRFATGVAVLTSYHDGQRFGMTINSLTSVSLDPCQILVCINHGSGTGEAIKASGVFAVSLLDVDQGDVSRAFVGRDATRFATAASLEGMGHVPIIDGALASVTCEVGEILTSGDHEIVIGNVVTCEYRDGAPLIFFGGKYGRLEQQA